MARDVTVLITCYNERAYVGEAIDSIAGQTAFDRVARILVVNNGSTDDSAEFLEAKKAQTPRLDVMNLMPNIGAPAARNTGLKAIDTEWVAYLDGDDYWVPEKLARQLALVDAADPKIDLVYSDLMQFSDKPENAIPVKCRSLNTAGEELLRLYFLYEAPIMPSTVLMRTAAARAIDYFNPDIRLFEETDFFMRLAGSGYRFAHQPEFLIYKRVRAGSLSSQIANWEEAMLRETRHSVRRYPQLAPFAARRDGYRLAKVADAYFSAGEDAKGWRHLRGAIIRNPLNPRAYFYGLTALVPRGWRGGLRDLIRRWRAGGGRKASAQT